MSEKNPRFNSVENTFYKLQNTIDNLMLENARLKSALEVAHEALQWSKEMFVARDQMNAKVHCSPVRLSPITEHVSLAFSEIEKLMGGEE